MNFLSILFDLAKGFDKAVEAVAKIGTTPKPRKAGKKKLSPQVEALKDLVIPAVETKASFLVYEDPEHIRALAADIKGATRSVKGLAGYKRRATKMDWKSGRVTVTVWADKARTPFMLDGADLMGDTAEASFLRDQLIQAQETAYKKWGRDVAYQLRGAAYYPMRYGATGLHSASFGTKAGSDYPMYRHLKEVASALEQETATIVMPIQLVFWKPSK
jgi:hypothetical protein